MRKYVHWLKINGLGTSRDEAEQFLQIENYLKQYPNSTALLYQYDSGSFDLVVKLECFQDYQNLDLIVNSFSSSLVRLSSKPKNIGREKEFSFPEKLRKYLVA